MTAESVWLDEPRDAEEQLWRQRVQDEQPLPEPRTPHGRLVAGGEFLFAASAEPPAIWGSGTEVAWAEGEPFMLTGPPGVGKTTLGGQLVAGRCGFIDDVLGMPVRAGMRTLYLACDRPKQIARALRRQFDRFDRDLIDQRLIVWKGPPAVDLARQPTHLLELVRAANADTVVIDSAKDVALKLSDDETGQGFNQALQHCVAEGVEVMVFHHQTKRGGGGTGKPNTLADVYGSAWLTAGMGSVMLLWGDAGDPVVELIHLKQPAEPIGPLRISHDHQAGISTLAEGLSIFELLRRKPLSAREVADAMYGSTTRANVEKARRKLAKLVADSHVIELAAPDSGGAGGGGQGTRYGLRTHQTDPPGAVHGAVHAPDPTDDPHDTASRSTPPDHEAVHDAVHAVHAPSGPRSSLSLERAGATTCTECDEPMTLIEPNQTTHPGCDR